MPNEMEVKKMFDHLESNIIFQNLLQIYSILCKWSATENKKPMKGARS